MSTTAARQAARTFLRDFAVDGVPASGANEPAKLDGRAAFEAVADAVDAAQAVADAAVAGIRWTAAVRVRSTGNVAISTALENGDTLNGVALATGDRIFLGSQTAPAENGIYVVAASGAAARATDADTAGDLSRIAFVITEGTVGAGERWTLPLSTGSITVGSTALAFVQVGVEVDYASEINARLNRLPEVFEPAATDEYAKALFLSCSIEFGEPGHVYFLNYRTRFDGATYQIRVQLENETRGQTVAVIERAGASAAAVKAKLAGGFAYLSLVSLGNPLDEEDYAPYVGTCALVQLDLDAIDWSKVQTTYTDSVQTRIKTTHVHSTEEMMADWRLGARPAQTLTVGATGCDFTTVTAAIESLYDPDLVGSITASSHPISNLCSWSRQVMIKVIDDAYTEELDGPTLPQFLTIRGRGKANTLLTATGDGGGTPRVFEAPHSCRFQDLTGRQNGGGYACHHDALNAIIKDATDDPQGLLYTIMQIHEDVRWEAASANSSPILGCGLSNGHWIIARRCDFRREGSAATEMVFVHNSPNDLVPGGLEFTDCTSNDAEIVGSNGFLFLRTNAAYSGARRPVVLTGSDVGKVSSDNPQGEAFNAFVRQGRWDGITYSPDLDPA